jgi:hypothetical protein
MSKPQSSAGQSTKTVCGFGENRAPLFTVLIKRRYRLDIQASALVEADAPPGFVGQDIYHGMGDPAKNSVRHEVEDAPYKPNTDVVVVGTLKTRQRSEKTVLDVGVQVAGIGKIVRVFGDRQCIYRKDKTPQFSDPMPFIEMPIQYERAYGGRDKISLPDEELHYPRNPVGVGYACSNTEELIDGLPLPNYEDPQDLLTQDNLILPEPELWNRQPLPQGFGWLARNSHPRFCHAGLIPPYLPIDEVPREAALGLVPEDLIARSRQFKLPSFDPRFANGASLGMRFAYLQPKQLVVLAHLCEEQAIIEFSIPTRQPASVRLDLGQGHKPLDTQIQTVSINLDTQEVDIIWQACQPMQNMAAFSEIKRVDYEVIEA